MSVLTYADLQGTTMRASHELKGTNLGGQFQGSLGHKLGAQLQELGYALLLKSYSQFCFKDVWP